MTIFDAAPRIVPESAITIAYVCGDKFKYKNNGNEPVTLVYKVRQSLNGDILTQAGIPLAPGEERVFKT